MLVYSKTKRIHYFFFKGTPFSVSLKAKPKGTVFFLRVLPLVSVFKAAPKGNVFVLRVYPLWLVSIFEATPKRTRFFEGTLLVLVLKQNQKDTFF